MSIDKYSLVNGATPSKIEKSSNSDSTLFIYAEYSVITYSTGPEVGENIIVYKNGLKKKSLESYYDFGHQSAGYFFGIAGGYLFIDGGTGPGLRGLEVFDLNKKAFILKDAYQDPIQFRNDTLVYWTEDSILATEKNCNGLKEWEKNGNGGEIQYLKKVVLRKNEVINTGKKRCSITQ